ncbi:uncharacterized protein [Clytia hemisphaerica]|uniref:Uncharacterized protein n=1 Tax=Clytia hemisphaerica TaxID=252671 RepID=A0A7M5VBJ2_9CNID
MKERQFCLLVILFTLLGELYSSLPTAEKELRRTKRTVYQALLKRKDNTAYVDLENQSTTSKPYIARQSRELKIEFLLNRPWRDEMANRTSPEFKLLSGNIADAVSNELVADFNFITSTVLRLRNGKSKTYVDISLRFFNTEINAQRHLQGIISKGWISGQSVDPNYFKLLNGQSSHTPTATNHKNLYGGTKKIEYSQPLSLHHKPAEGLLHIVHKTPQAINEEVHKKHASPQEQNATSATKQQQPQHVAQALTQPSTTEAPPKQFYLQYKETEIVIKLAATYQEYLQDKQSPEFRELSGNIEQAVSKALSKDEYYINCTLVKFSESGGGHVIAFLKLRFRHEELFVIEKCQSLITSGLIDGMPVDDRFFRVLSLSETDEQGENLHSLTDVDGKIPKPSQSKYHLKLLPLHYVEISYSIKIKEAWADDLSDNNTVHYGVFSGHVEQAVDRSLAENPNYIDCNVVEFLESSDKLTIGNIVVHFYQNETNPEPVVLNTIKNGSLSGIHVDPTFFVVFSISYRLKGGAKGATQPPQASTTTQDAHGQKQQAQYNQQPNIDTGVLTTPVPYNSAYQQPNNPVSPCQQQQQNAEESINNKQVVGAFVPQCQSDGTYKPVQCHALTGFCWCVDGNGARVQGTEERFKMPNCGGFKIYGTVALLDYQQPTIPAGSCLSVYVQEAVSCGNNVNCQVPITGNKTFHDIQLQNGSISYELMLPSLKETTYWISGVVNMGWCRLNSLKTSDLVHEGDYHTTSNEEFYVNQQNNLVQKDLVAELVTIAEIGIRLHGDVILPESNIQFSSNSCLAMETKLLQPCNGADCTKLMSSNNHTIRNLTAVGNRLPYEVHLTNLNEGTYVISIVIHIGACAESDGQAIVDGDYYNEDMEEFTIDDNTNDVEKDISVVKLQHSEGGVSISGRVLFPPETTSLQSGSCLSVSTRKLIKCKNKRCKIPPVASKTWEMVKYQPQGIPYTLFLPIDSPGSYLVSAVINNGWCKSQVPGKWIRPGDLYNDKIHDFELKSPATSIGKNIQTAIFTGEEDTGNKTQLEKPEPAEIAVDGQIFLPSNNSFIPPHSCLTVKVLQDCQNTSKCGHELIAGQVFHDLHVDRNNSLPYYVELENITSTGSFSISYILNIGWCHGENTTSAFDVLMSGDLYADEQLVIEKQPTGFIEMIKDVYLNLFEEPTTTPVATTPVPFATTETYTTTAVQTSGNPLVAGPNGSPTVVIDNSTTNATLQSSPQPSLESDELVTLPKGLPRSCAEIRDSGVGKMDGQYIVEARENCHLSLICQDMEGENPKEFLGGPNEEEWKYWHFAVLIKISQKDKENIADGACLEKSDRGKDLLKRIVKAGLDQNNPVQEWRSKLSKLLRAKRNTLGTESIISKAKTIYAESKQEGSWGVI